jgi:hypothetical protein
MKKILTFLLLSVVMVSAYSQQTNIDKFYNRFRSYDKGGEEMKSAFSINGSFSGGDGKGWFNKITQFRLLVLDSKKTPSLMPEWDGLIRALGKDEYEELVSFRQGKDYARLLLKEVGEGLKDVVLLCAGKDGGCLFVNLRGRFTIHDIDQIQHAFHGQDVAVK